MPEAIIVFIKNIVPGKVKTRLAATVGDAQAVKIYEALLARTRREVEKVAADRYVFYSSFVEADDGWEDRYFKRIQFGKDMGERMSNAFVEIMPPCDKAVLVGGDIAGLSAGILRAGLEKLDTYDFVLGPAIDGGYYLIGMKGPAPGVFANIAWSTEKVAQQTLEKIKALNKTVYLLPPLSDIDYEEDWRKYGWKL